MLAQSMLRCWRAPRTMPVLLHSFIVGCLPQASPWAGQRGRPWAGTPSRPISATTYRQQPSFTTRSSCRQCGGGAALDVLLAWRGRLAVHPRDIICPSFGRERQLAPLKRPLTVCARQCPRILPKLGGICRKNMTWPRIFFFFLVRLFSLFLRRFFGRVFGGVCDAAGLRV